MARLEMRANVSEVRAGVAPMLAALEEAEATDLADQAIAEWLAGDLGVVGIEATMRALEMGQVDQLVIDEGATIDEELRAELVRQASLTDAAVQVVHEHPGLARHGGVAATLRYRL